MGSIEDNLRNYRSRRARQEKIKHFLQDAKGVLKFTMKDENSNLQSDKTALCINQPEVEANTSKSDAKQGDEMICDMDVEISDFKGSLIKLILRIVFFAFWATLYIIAIELEFGAVFLMFSALAAIYINTRTAPRKSNEISAYSVFNKNCESIDGTLKAAQFERELGIKQFSY